MSLSPIARASGATALARIWQVELADRERRIHRRARGSRTAAEILVAHPEVDAHRLALVRVDPRLAERRPAPRPDRVSPELFCHLADGERLKLDDLEPLRARLQALAAARPRRGLELELERNPVSRDPDLGEAPDERAHPSPHRPARTDGPERVQLGHVRGGEIDLPDQDRHGGEVAPPLRRLSAGVGRVGDRHQRRRAALRQPPDQRERVRTVLRRRRRPRRRRLRSEELVQRDPGRRAAGHRHGEVEETVCAARDRRGVGRNGRRPDAVVEVEVEEDGRGSCCSCLRGLDRARRERERQPGLLWQRRVVPGEVDPQRRRVGNTALPRQCAPRQDQGCTDSGEYDGGTHASSCSGRSGGLGTGGCGKEARHGHGDDRC
jgi:hypothetical protein